MRFLLLTVLCSVAALTVAVKKPKRDILPGDPRYGTDNHNHHDHQEKELEVSKSLGGYVGSYSTLDDEVKQGYGPPNYQPSKPLNLDQHTTIVENNAQVSVPAYENPEVNQVEVLNKQYLSPVIAAAKKVQTKTLTTFSKPVETTLLNKETVDYLTPSVQAPVTSYGDPVEIKTVENPENPTFYEVPAVKTKVVPLLETKVEQDVLPQVHDHLEETKTVHKIQVKSQLPVPQVSEVAHQIPVLQPSLALPVNNLATPLTTANTDFSNLAPPTIGGHPITFYNNHLQSQPDFNTAYQLYLRNIGSFGTQQKLLNGQYPNLYVSPYTYGVPYQFPQSSYTSQSVPTQLNHLVPYPLAENGHLSKTNDQVKQFGSISTFFQELFPNFPISFPLSDSIFQLPTSAPPTATATDVETLKTVHVEKPLEVQTTDHLLDSKPVAFDTSSLTKTSTVFDDKTSNEYIQPVDENGGYVY